MACKIEQNELFISEWIQEECLWNVTVEAYKNRNARQAALKKIGEKLSMTVSCLSFFRSI